MHSYLYPTVTGWFENVISEWKNSGKRYLCFPFLWFEPQKLPKVSTKEFWLYLYYTEKQTPETDLQRVVQYRAKVVHHDLKVIEGADIYLHNHTDAKMYFKCEVIEELRKENGQFLKESDFEHVDQGKVLLSAIRNSIAPVKRISPTITVQRTMYWLND